MMAEAMDDDIVLATEIHGRVVTVRAGIEVDDCGQFSVALFVDGKQRFEAFFTDKGGDR